MPRQTSRSWLHFAVVLVTVVAVACTASPPSTTIAAPSTAPVTTTTTLTMGNEYCAGSVGGQLVLVTGEEPIDFHPHDPQTVLPVTGWVAQGALEGLTGVSTGLEYIPELLDRLPSIDQEDGAVRARFELRPGLVWSDGQPLTARDVEFTYEAIMAIGPLTDRQGNPIDANGDGVTDEGHPYQTDDRELYESIAELDVRSETEFEITWTAFHPGWLSAFDIVFPAHRFSADPPQAAAELDVGMRTWTDPAGERLPSSGPLAFGAYDPGDHLELERNPGYHGSVSPDAANRGAACIESVRIDFEPRLADRLAAMRDGGAHVLYGQPQLPYDELSQNERFTVAVTPGATYDHWGVNLLNPHLADPLVREALAFALDKEQVVSVLYRPIFGDTLPADGLYNSYFMPTQPAYEPHGLDYTGPNVEAARTKLTEAGYGPGDAGIMVHPDRGPLSLRVGTTGGDPIRELQQTIIQQQLAAAGFDIVIDNVAGSDYFARGPFSEPALSASLSGGAEGDSTVWDITQFAWVGGPWPGAQSDAYRSDSGFMPYGHVNGDFNARAGECDATIDEAERNRCYNELDLAATTLDGLSGDGGMFVFPITQRPDFYVYNNELLSAAAAAPDIDIGGPLVNVVDFKLAN